MTMQEASMLFQQFKTIENDPKGQYVERMTQLVEDLMRYDDKLEFAKAAIERMEGHIAGVGMALYRFKMPSEAALEKCPPETRELWRKLSARMQEKPCADN